MIARLSFKKQLLLLQLLLALLQLLLALMLKDLLLSDEATYNDIKRVVNKLLQVIKNQ